ncbi:MAG: exodeoxyribonuclease III [Muribaculaceae bacterium]|nr:exodeoxyribonuclease III [Muribaculaceae bacterium]
MKFVSWNVNGLRAVVGKGFADIFGSFDADFFCLQEIKLKEGQLDLNFEGYEAFYNYADRPGYSGTAIFTRHKPLSVRRHIGIDAHDHEGRIVALEYPGFYLVDVYVPNSQSELARLPYRMEWERDFLSFLKELDATKPVVMCGDLNVAHQEIDLANPKTNRRNAGFTDEERECMSRLLASGFTDTFRFFNPDTKGAYSWWSYRGRAREKNVGWRIDYFIVSDRLADRLVNAEIHPDVTGSDHCPVSVEIDLDAI